MAGTRSRTQRSSQERLLTLLETQEGADSYLRREVAWKLTARDFAHLAWGVSAEEILPSWAAIYTTPRELGRFALTGIPGVAEDQLANASADVIVAGGRFGVGSSREQAVLALMGAGIRYVLVVGGPAERIFKENCLLIGGPVILELTDDLEAVNGALAAIRSHRAVSESWVDPVRSQIREAGGLFPYVQRRKLQGTGVVRGGDAAASLEHVPRSGVERLLARRTGLPLRRGDVAFVPTDLRYSYDIMSRLLESTLERGVGEAWPSALADPQSIMLFEDHLCYSNNVECHAATEHQRVFAKRAAVSLRVNSHSPGCDGICHSVIIEEALVTPGQICVGTDSHTCTVGVLGALAFGIGTTSMAAAFASGEVLIEVPPTVRVELDGDLRPGVSAKDVMLHLLSQGDVARGCCVGRVLEFAGPALARWPLDEQAVLTNMAVEAGAFTGIIGTPTPAVCRHLQLTRGMTTSEVVAAWPVSAGKESCDLVISLDLGRVPPMVALPPKPSNAAPVGRMAGKAVTSGYIGSCAGGNLTDLRIAAEILAHDTVKVPLVVQPATQRVMEMAGHEGLLAIFRNAGAEVLAPGCGACCGMGPGGVEASGDVIIATSPRNYPGRMGLAGGESPHGAVNAADPADADLGRPGTGAAHTDHCGTGEVLLASPATVAASCLYGRITAPADAG